MPPTGPQLRHPRAGTGTGAFRHGGYYPSYGYYPYYGYYDPYFYGYGWYSPFYWGGYYAPGYAYGGAPYSTPQRYGSPARVGQVRVQVQPSQTRVYVDGYYAGVADDFDGLFQRLNVSAGAHDISLRLEGYQTYNVKVHVPLDDTIKFQHKMQRGAGEETAAPVGMPVDYSRYAEREQEEREEQAREEEYAPEREAPGERAVVRLDVQPADASVYVDGVFRGTGRDLRELRLPAGRHRLEVVRPGYRTIERDVELAPGQTLDVGILLDRG